MAGSQGMQIYSTTELGYTGILYAHNAYVCLWWYISQEHTHREFRTMNCSFSITVPL